MAAPPSLLLLCYTASLSRERTKALREEEVLAQGCKERKKKEASSAVVATARKLAVIVYNMLKNKTSYQDLGHDFLDKLLATPFHLTREVPSKPIQQRGMRR